MRIGDIVFVRHRFAHVPILTFRKAKREVVLFGMIHTALAGFFTDIMKRIESYEKRGYRILYECLDGPLDTHPATKTQKHLRKRLDYKVTLVKKRFGELGFEYQTDHIAPKPSWILADFDRSDWKRYSPGKKRFEIDVDYIDRFERTFRDIDAVIGALSEMYRDPDREIELPEHVQLRDKRALTCILEHAEHSSIATAWGAGHLPGIRHGLEQHGYVITDREWVRAFPV